ncbi:MAG: polyhydroxyalkanoic acid synthase [Gammaproteobacteria bacterium]|nr:polyhydroxyalkanoic acid synthase [Gammaproteobacteria bacterium]
MGDIDIRHPHSLPLPRAREAIEEAAQRLSQKFGIDYAWDGDRVDFRRSGLDGRIHLAPGELRVTARLGFLLSAMKGPIETEIRRVLAERLGS